MNKEKITIIRTAVGCLSAMTLINELRKRHVRVVGTDCNPLSAGLYLCDKSYIVPRGNDPKFLSEMLRICDIEKPCAIISGPEEEVLVLSKNKPLFEEKNVLVLCPDYDTVKICVDKLETHNVFRKYHIPTPKIYEIDKVEFPCIVKPRFGRGGKSVFKVDNMEELRLYVKKVDNPIIQEFINGIEYTIDIFADLKGKPLSIVPRIRLQVESGISVKAMTIYDEEIINYCRRIVEKLKLIGPACIQCIRDEKDGTIKFTEINPRFGGGSILSIKADPTIITNLIRIIRNDEPIQSTGFREGLIMLRYYSEIFLPADNNVLGYYKKRSERRYESRTF